MSPEEDARLLAICGNCRGVIEGLHHLSMSEPVWVHRDTMSVYCPQRFAVVAAEISAEEQERLDAARSEDG